MSQRDLLYLDLPARLSCVALARDAVASLATELGLTDEDREALRLAVGEACNNAVLHAPASTSVTVRGRIDDSELIIEIENDGSFTPDTPASMPDTAAEGGRGRALMEALTDSVEYRASLKRTLVRLRKALPVEPHESEGTL